MKRIFVFAASVSLSAALASAALAQGGGQNLIGDAAPNQNVVQPEQSRGQLGGLASGAPSFASNLRDLRGPGNAVAAGQPVPQQAGAAVTTETQTAVQGQTVAVERQAITPIQSFHQLAMVRQHCLFFSRPTIKATQTPFGPVFGAQPIPAVARTPGDLEIAGIGMVADATPEQGPLYRVTIRNNSETPSRHFEVSLIAIRGQLNPTSPIVTVHVDEIAAAGVHELDVQLPIGVMSLGAANALAPFESLVVAIDSFDQLIEINELNNVAVLTRGDIALIETATATTTTTATATAPAAVAAPGAAAPAPAEAAPGAAAPAPSANDAPAPGDTTLAAPAQPNAPAAGGAPAEQVPPASSEESELESLVPKS